MNKIFAAACVLAVLQIVQSEVLTLGVLCIVCLLFAGKLLGEAAERN